MDEGRTTKEKSRSKVKRTNTTEGSIRIQSQGKVGRFLCGNQRPDSTETIASYGILSPYSADPPICSVSPRFEMSHGVFCIPVLTLPPLQLSHQVRTGHAHGVSTRPRSSAVTHHFQGFLTSSYLIWIDLHPVGAL